MTGLINRLNCVKKATSITKLVCIEVSRTSIIKSCGLNMEKLCYEMNIGQTALNSTELC